MSTSASTFDNPLFEDVKRYNTEQLVTFLKRKNLNLGANVFTSLRSQEVDGLAFVALTFEQLISFLTVGNARKLTSVIEELNNQSKFYH